MLLLWWLVLVTGCLATYDIVCSDTTAKNKIENAINDAKAMARSTQTYLPSQKTKVRPLTWLLADARDLIADLEKDTTKAAFTPLFKEKDVGELTRKRYPCSTRSIP
jgi:hypothetical protein